MVIDRRIDVAVSDDQVIPAIVIVIEKACTPSQERDSRFAQTGLKGNVREVTLAFIVVEHVRIVGKVRDVKINSAVVVVISNRQSHPRLLAAVFIQGDA